MVPQPPPHQRLEDAVLGLSGIVAFLVLPTLVAYARLLLEMLERRGGLAARRGPSGLGVARAAAWTFVSAFFAYAWVRAAADLRDLQLEAPVLALSLRGAAAGAAAFVLLSLGLSLVRRRRRHRRWEQRLGPGLR